MNKQELIALIKLEYGKAEDYFGLAASCGFEVIEENEYDVQMSYRWPLYTEETMFTPSFSVEDTQFQIKMWVIHNVAQDYIRLGEKQLEWLTRNGLL